MADATLKTASTTSGQAGEDAALDYLIEQGLTLVERNFRCRHGEIDLIMQQQSVLVFVEVKKRASARFGGAAASVTPAKQARLVTAAHIYLQKYHRPPACRFDVLAIEGEAFIWLQNVIDS
jgi:putative endonuclease